MQDSKIRSVEGRAIPLPGDEIDTDRIIPARFLRCVTFDGIEAHAFEDDRRDHSGKVTGKHPFDDARFQGASILIANRNFGCGSSREHAPQALVRWGIRAFIAESFAEIFFGNCLALGTPCATASHDDVLRLQDWAGRHPAQPLTLDLEFLKALTPDFSVPVHIPASPRESLLKGTWDATGMLLADMQAIAEVASRLPYVAGFR
jgi:3-isopropylmalate/(R)-2-methylmalate dehydratase small subunit